MIYKTQGELESALTRWQKILRLQDWDITVEMVTFREINQDWGASVDKRSTHKRAHIKVREDGHWAHGDIFEHDHDTDLVHELLHLHTHALRFADTDEDHEFNDEVLINMITSSLITLDRKTTT